MTQPHQASLVIHRTLPASCEEVFDAWRDPAIMTRWFSTPGWWAQIESDFRVGGRYRIRKGDDSGAVHEQFGDYLVIEPVSRLVFTWSFQQLGVKDSIVTVVLKPRGEQTQLTLTHALPSGEVERLHREGWNRCFEQLELVLVEDSQGDSL